MKTLLYQFMRYGLVGVINTLVTLMVVFVLFELAGAHYLTANAVGYALGIINSYVLNRFLTFTDSRMSPRAFAAFIGVFLFSYAVSQGFLWVLIETLTLNKRFSIIAAMGVYTLLSFPLNKYLVFKDTARGDVQVNADVQEPK